MLDTILVGYHGTAPARRALEEAVRLAKAEGARLVVVAVGERLPLLDGATVGEVRDQQERRQDACHLWLWAAQSYAAQNGVRTSTEIRFGRPARELARAAAAHQADLLVVGRTSTPGLWARLAGTQTERLCRYSSCRIMIPPVVPAREVA